MSEGGEKTELPSPKKVRDARAKGQVARSQEVVTTVSLMSVIAYIWATWSITVKRLVSMFDVVASLSTGDIRLGMFTALEIIGKETMAIIFPVVGVAILAAILSNYFQVGSIFALENIMPSLDKISPASGFKKIFSMKQLVETLKSIIKIVFLSILLYIVLKKAIGEYVNSLYCGLPCISNVTASVLFDILVYSAVAFVIVAVADFAYQKHSYTKGLMMSKDEVKREYKESEGDPHIKGHRKQLALEILMGDGGHAASKSSAVVVNPTHVAVCIRYVEGETPLPIIVAKGLNKNAHYLRAEAERAGVPVFRNVRLARALYADAELDDYVPDDLFDAVAEVLAWVSKNRNLLYHGPLDHGVIDMDAGDHRISTSQARN